MKVLKGFFLSGIIFILALLLVFLQVHMTFNRTLLSSDYFNSSFEEYNISTTLNDMVFYKINNISLTSDNFKNDTSENPTEDSLPSLNVGKKILEYIDQGWFEVQASNVAKGTYSYLMSSSNNLPTIEIETIKENLIDDLVDELLSREETQTNLAVIDKIFPILDNKYVTKITDGELNEDLIDEIMQLDLVIKNNLDKETVTIMLQVYKENKENEIENIDEEIVSRIFKTKFNFSNIDGDLDLNEVLNRIFPNDNNPLTSLRTFIASYKSIVIRMLLVLILILLIIIFLTNISIFSALNWVASGSIIAGLTGLVFGLLGFFPLITKALYYNILSKIDVSDKIESISNLQNWVEAYMHKFFSTLIIQGSVLIVLSIITFVTILILSRYNDNSEKLDGEYTDVDEVEETGTDAGAVAKSKPKNSMKILTVLRVIVVIVLLTLVPFTIKWAIEDFTEAINKFSSVMESNSGNLENVDLTELIPEMIINK